MDEYDCVASGRLKLKTDSDPSKKKKKKKNKQKEKEKLERAVKQLNDEEPTETRNAPSSTASKLTKAEMAFKKGQEKMREKRILEKASQTHKQRVEKFNEHLDSLTEHFDIPKVSWTK